MVEGQLVLVTREKNGKLNGLRNYCISLSFASKQDAEQEFNKLCKLYKPISDIEKLVNRDNKKIAVYKLNQLKTFPNQVEFVLTQHDLFNNSYKIIFGDALRLSYYYKID